ncbi:MAG: hypothetical protein ACREJ5_01540 [Geminicoccaceae bacterium]
MRFGPQHIESANWIADEDAPAAEHSADTEHGTSEIHDVSSTSSATAKVDNLGRQRHALNITLNQCDSVGGTGLDGGLLGQNEIGKRRVETDGMSESLAIGIIEAPTPQPIASARSRSSGP